MLDLRNMDCNELFPTLKDKEIDLAIVDPPYGINVNSMMLGSGKYMTDKQWDAKAPDEKYFQELFRVSKNQIIWGANHFLDTISKVTNVNSSCWLVWDKNNGESDFADCELAWTSFESPVRKCKFNLVQQDQYDIKKRFHPTQKPVYLYEWILSKYAVEGSKILDTHLGSMSIAIACHNYKMNLLGTEIDEEYYKKGMERVKLKTSQETLF